MKIRTSKINAPPQIPDQEQIARRAREIWEASGRPDNRDIDNWLQAEKELLWRGSRNAVHVARIDPKSPT